MLDIKLIRNEPDRVRAAIRDFILEDDFMRVPDEQISEIPIAMTVVGGKVVYDAATDGR